MIPETEAAPQARGAGHLALLIVVLAGPVLVFATRWLTPDARGYGTHEQLGLGACWWREELGFPCPACGVTTSVALVARGEIAEALAVQPFGALLALATPIFALAGLWAHRSGRDLRTLAVSGRFARPFAIAVGILLLGAWAYKACPP